jgi:hypothetical protein
VFLGDGVDGIAVPVITFFDLLDVIHDYFLLCLTLCYYTLNIFLKDRGGDRV